MKKHLSLALVIAMLILTAGCGGAPSAPVSGDDAVTDGQWKPKKDITFVVPFDAGGTADIPARIISKYLTKYSDKPVNVVNMPGAGGRVGAKRVQNENPDGHMFTHVPTGFFMQKATGVADFSYEDFYPVTSWCDSWVGLVVKADSPYNTYEEFVAAAKAKPGELKVGGATGTLPLLAEMAIEEKEGIKFNLVDLGSAAKSPELLSGRVEAYMDGVGALKQYVDAKEFKCLMIFSYEPVPGFDGVPIAAELGYENFEYLLQSFGMWAPKDTPKEAVDYMANLVKLASEDPECIAEFEKLCYGTRYDTPEEYLKVCETVMADTVEAVKPLMSK